MLDIGRERELQTRRKIKWIQVELTCYNPVRKNEKKPLHDQKTIVRLITVKVIPGCISCVVILVAKVSIVSVRDAEFIDWVVLMSDSDCTHLVWKRGCELFKTQSVKERLWIVQDSECEREAVNCSRLRVWKRGCELFKTQI